MQIILTVFNEIMRIIIFRMKELGGGIILDLGIYAIQFAQLVYKEKPTKVICAGHLGVGDVDESVSCILTYGNGRIANLTIHSKVLLPNEAVIVGTKGSVKVNNKKIPLSSLKIIWLITRRIIVANVLGTDNFANITRQYNRMAIAESEAKIQFSQ